MHDHFSTPLIPACLIYLRSSEPSIYRLQLSFSVSFHTGPILWKICLQIWCLKGTVSPDIGFYFRFWKFKLVLSEGPLMVFTFFLFRSSWDIKKLIFKLLLWETLLIMQTLPKAVPEYMFGLTDFALRTLAGFRKPLVYCESGFRKPLRQATGGFQ